ncbi:IS3 family transposase, partial [Facklamia hominis]
MEAQIRKEEATNEERSKLVYRLRHQYKLKDLLQYVGLIKQTYYNWVKKFDRPNPDQAIETQLLELREQHPN